MSKGNTFEADVLALIFNATAIANIAQNGVSPLTDLHVSIHTSDPTDAGTQTSNETGYTGYARVAVARTTGGWAVSGTNPTVVSPVANIDFPECSAVPGAAITHFGVGVSAFPTAGKLLYSGTVTPNITMAVGVIPRLKTTSTISED
jgi:hypothetical protein